MISDCLGRVPGCDVAVALAFTLSTKLRAADNYAFDGRPRIARWRSLIVGSALRQRRRYATDLSR